MQMPGKAALRGAIAAAFFLFFSCASAPGRPEEPPARNVRNVVWQPGAEGKDSSGKPVDFRQPVFSEDYAVLDDLGRQLQDRLLLTPTLFEAAQKAGIATFALGKNGAAYLQDLKRGGMLLDEK